MTTSFIFSIVFHSVRIRSVLTCYIVEGSRSTSSLSSRKNHGQPFQTHYKSEHHFLSLTRSRTGFQPLKITANYFGNLQAHFGPKDEKLEALKGHRILDGLDEASEFFQLDGRSRPNGFFFEIIERRGSYDSYGAPNAIFRLATQKR